MRARTHADQVAIDVAVSDRALAYYAHPVECKHCAAGWYCEEERRLWQSFATLYMRAEERRQSHV